MIKTKKYHDLIKEYYGSAKAKRSNVPYINHINEGLIVLDKLGSSEIAKSAYCIHPIFQDDINLKSNKEKYLHDIDSEVLFLSMEYRNVANRGLCCYQVDNPDSIYLGPIKEVHEMLVADKVQNRKDFIRYHLGTHPKSIELDHYFKNWLRALKVTEHDYNNYCLLIDLNRNIRNVMVVESGYV